LQINIKDVESQPVVYFLDKSTVPPVIFLWGVQNIPNTSIVYNRIRQIQDVGNLQNTPDITVLYSDAMCWGLAARLAFIYVPEKYDIVSGMAEKIFRLAAQGDRYRCPVTNRSV